jgi:hypothetical protein
LLAVLLPACLSAPASPTDGGVGADDGGAGSEDGNTAVPPPLSYYSFDEPGDILVDATGRTSGVFHGGTLVEGQVGMARMFDGTSEFAELHDLPHLPALSVSVWVRISSLPEGDVAVFDRWPWPTGERSFYLGITDAGSQPRMAAQGSITSEGAGNPMLRDPDELPMNTWLHFAATWDQSVLRFYRDGVSVAGPLQAQGPLFDTSSHAILIARSRHVTPVHLAVAVDELAVWDHALSGAAIARIHQRGLAGQPTLGE